MRAALLDNDAEALGAAGHGMRGSSATVGAPRLAVLAKYLEDIAAGPIEPREAVIGRIESECALVRRAIDENLAALGLPPCRS